MNCNYCNGVFTDDLINNDSNGLHILNIDWSEDDGKAALVMCSPFGIFATEIKFCPVCGRELKDERH